MTQDYYGTKRITAWLQEKDGVKGYAVKYADGYISWSPADVFDAAYQPLDELSFGHAIEALFSGHKVARRGWNGKGMWVNLQVPDENSKMTQPYIYMKTANDDLIPWLASQADMLANDWVLLDD